LKLPPKRAIQETGHDASAQTKDSYKSCDLSRGVLCIKQAHLLTEVNVTKPMGSLTALNKIKINICKCHLLWHLRTFDFIPTIVK